ncbi:integrin alpha, partial [Nocardia tengchongensis]|uniref:integrin alpha n=1 Tax=Nocardia tengchongensis TaxID=2055889 RepID=UPI0036146ABF
QSRLGESGGHGRRGVAPARRRGSEREDATGLEGLHRDLRGQLVEAGQAAPVVKNTDFNGDGYNDLAVGLPTFPGYQGTQYTGLVGVLYGGPDGFTGHKTFQPKPGCSVPTGDTTVPCRYWGQGLAASDVDADRRTDLIFTSDRELEVRSC